MLSALLGEKLAQSFGVAELEQQSAHQRAYSPLPLPGGHLVQDPDFSLPTIAGALPWRLFHYSALPNTEGPFGYGRRASWPLRLCADVTGSIPAGYLVTVTMEREDGNAVQYIGNSPAGAGFPATYTANSPRLFDNLVNHASGDGTWNETRFATGALFHYPAFPSTSLTNYSMLVSLSYYQTVQGQIVTMNYNGDGTLGSLTEPAGRQLQYSYESGLVSEVTDWAGRSHQFAYDGNDNLVQITDPTGVTIQSCSA